MITRRSFARRLGSIASAAPLLGGEAFLARRALGAVIPPRDLVRLDANENPEGPPASARQAMVLAIGDSGRYHFELFDGFAAAVARSEGLQPEQVMFGVGSTEILNAAISAFTSPSRPLITAEPTFEIPVQLTQFLGRKVVQVPLTDKFSFPVKRLAEEAGKAGGGLIYLCNPNNPTSSTTPKGEVDWLVANLPNKTVLLMDEAYIHFTQSADVASAVPYIQQNKDVLVIRTFSKIYGMAGVRAGFGCAKPEFIRKMWPFKNNIMPVVALRAAEAALAEASTLVHERRANNARIGSELCAWLREKNVRYIEPHANFLMIDVRRDVRGFGAAMFKKGVSVGRPFPPLNNMLRVTLGTDADMARFREAFWQVYSG